MGADLNAEQSEAEANRRKNFTAVIRGESMLQKGSAMTDSKAEIGFKWATTRAFNSKSGVISAPHGNCAANRYSMKFPIHAAPVRFRDHGECCCFAPRMNSRLRDSLFSRKMPAEIAF